MTYDDTLAIHLHQATRQGGRLDRPCSGAQLVARVGRSLQLQVLLKPPHMLVEVLVHVLSLIPNRLCVGRQNVTGQQVYGTPLHCPWATSCEANASEPRIIVPL